MNNQEMEKMSLLQFFIRFAAYCIFGGIIPFMFLVWRFKLFSTVSKISIGGWGILAIIVIGTFLIKLMKNVKKILEPYPAEVVSGIAKIIIPLIGLAFLTYYMRDMMMELFQFICVAIVCEMVAIISNPFPQWEEQNKINKEEKRISNLLKSFFPKGDDKK